MVLPSHRSYVGCCCRYLYNLPVPSLPIQCTIVLQLAARILFSKYCFNSWARELQGTSVQSDTACNHVSSAQAKMVQVGASPSPLPPLSMGLHLPCTSKSKADLLTANTALIQHVEMRRRTGSGPTSSVPAWSWHDTDLTCFHSRINPHRPPTLPAGSDDFADGVPQTRLQKGCRVSALLGHLQYGSISGQAGEGTGPQCPTAGMNGGSLEIRGVFSIRLPVMGGVVQGVFSGHI